MAADLNDFLSACRFFGKLTSGGACPVLPLTTPMGRTQFPIPLGHPQLLSPYPRTFKGGSGGRSRSFRDTSGFSLIEAMMALLILSVGCMAVVGMFMIAERATAHSTKRDDALALARQLLEWKLGLSYDDLQWDDRDGDGDAESQMAPVDDMNRVFESGDKRGVFHRQWELRRDQPAVGLSSLTVTISWRDQLGSTHRLALGTIRADPRAGDASIE